METTESPQDLQNQILQRLVKAPEKSSDEAPQVPAATEKFFKAFCDLFDNRLKDNAYHELVVEQSTVSSSSLHDFAKQGNEAVPLSLLCESEANCIGMMRYDATAATFITRLFLGGDIDVEVDAKSGPYSVCEIGVQNVFASWIAKSLRQQVTAEFPHITTTFPAEIDLNEITDHDVSVCSYFIVFGPNRCRFDVAVSDHLIAGETANASGPSFNDQLKKHEEVAKSPLNATIRLNAVPTTLRQIKQLRVGDCLSLADAGKLLGKFIVKDQEIYEGEIGKSAGRYSFKVSRTVQDTN